MLYMYAGPYALYEVVHGRENEWGSGVVVVVVVQVVVVGDWCDLGDWCARHECL